MMELTVFISGRVTGQSRDITLRNFERGKRLILQNGWMPKNPVEMVPESATASEAMAICCAFITSKACDGILLLNDTKFSEGSQIEESLARYCGKQIFYEDDLN